MRNLLHLTVMVMLLARAATKQGYPEECSDEEEVQQCEDNPIVDDINTSDDYWKADYKPSSLFILDHSDESGLDMFPSYTTPSMVTPSDNMTSFCYYSDKDNTSYVCQSEGLLDLQAITIPTNLRYLKINASGIRSIPGNVFDNHTMAALIINNNMDMKRISQKSFKGITGLKYLYMSGNEMIKWPRIEDSFFYIFRQASELRHLVLESNNITFKGKQVLWLNTVIIVASLGCIGYGWDNKIRFVGTRGLSYISQPGHDLYHIPVLSQALGLAMVPTSCHASNT